MAATEQQQKEMEMTISAPTLQIQTSRALIEGATSFIHDIDMSIKEVGWHHDELVGLQNAIGNRFEGAEGFETNGPFALRKVEATAEASKMFCVETLSPQIAELDYIRNMLQGMRQAVASTFGIDRPAEGAGVFGELAAKEKRVELEGEKDGLVGENGKLQPANRMKMRPIEQNGQSEDI